MEGSSTVASVSQLALNAPVVRPLRNILLALGLTICTLGVTGYFWQEAGYEMLIVTMGWPHVILGFAFYFGRVLRNEPGSRLSLVILTAITLSLWAIHYNYQITGLIYLYFLFHLFRDEIFVYFQTRSRHKSFQSVYSVAGVGPLILLMLLVPQQQDFRQDIRRIDFNSDKVASGEWTLISFQSVSASKGRQFYFYIQAPHTLNVRTFITYATEADVIRDGSLLVGDIDWPEAKDLVFVPQYGNNSVTAPAPLSDNPDRTEVLLTGGHRVGQTFTAQQNNLSGIWLPIKHFEPSIDTTRFSFHLASPPLLPYSRITTVIRDVLIVILSGLVLWRLMPRRNRRSQLWIYLVVFAGSFALVQSVLKSSSNAGYPFPLIFQFAVVFHYWSWYVFSFDKFSVNGSPPNKPFLTGFYDRVLAYLRQPSSFAWTVIALNLISAMGVIWFYKAGGPTVLRYGFDYNWFLYILVFHVTFSFRPTLRPGQAPGAFTSQSAK